jgi:competence protein ComEA
LVAGEALDAPLGDGIEAAPGPAGRARLRLDPGRRGAAVLGVAVLVVAVATGVWVLSGRPHAAAVEGGVTDRPASSGSPANRSSVDDSAPATGAPATSGGGSAASAVLVVDVAGKVRHPGLYRLPAGSRVDDAVRAAGGVLPGTATTSLNLASKVSDGEQIVVGVPATTGGVVGGVAGGSGAGVAGGGSGGGGGTTGVLVDLNTATLEQLETLPGIGPALGQRILDWRAAHGSYTTVAQLNDVSGIGDIRFAQLKPLVSV